MGTDLAMSAFDKAHAEAKSARNSNVLTREDIKSALRQELASGLKAALAELESTVRADVRQELQEAVSQIREVCEKPARTGDQERSPSRATDQERTPSRSRQEGNRSSSTSANANAATSLFADWTASSPSKEGYVQMQMAELGLDEDQDSPRSNEEIHLKRQTSSERRAVVAETAAVRALKEWAQEQSEDRSFSSLEDFVKSHVFEHIAGILVVLNTLMVGIQTTVASMNNGAEPTQWHTFNVAIEAAFCVVFVTEWMMRVSVDGRSFFCGEAWHRNVFDTIIVGLQAFDQLIALFHVTALDGSIELLRATRILRIIRLLHLYKTLRTMASSIFESLSSLIPTISLLSMMIYTFSVLFTQLVMLWGKNTHEMTYWFGTLPRTALTLLECIAGGVSWDEPCYALFTDTGVFAGLAFLFYICCGVFVMLNVIMGVFINKAIKVAEEQTELDVACAISGTFMAADNHSQDELLSPTDITREVFNQKLQEPELQACFEALKIDMTQAQSLFDLIDTDRSGSVDGREIVEGCLRLKGMAKALDVSIMEQALYQLVEKVDNHIGSVDHQIHVVDRHLAKLTKGLSAFNRKLGVESVLAGDDALLPLTSTASTGSTDSARDLHILI